MDRSLLRVARAGLLIGLLDMLAIGLGMGVPILAVLFGLPLGWYFGGLSVAGRDGRVPLPPSKVSSLPLMTLRRPVGQSAGVALMTTLVLAVIWLPQLPGVLDTALSARDWGIPLVLFGSQASKIGWMVLMLVISPLLQFMAAVTGAVLRQMHAMKRREPAELSDHRGRSQMRHVL